MLKFIVEISEDSEGEGHYVKIVDNGEIVYHESIFSLHEYPEDACIGRSLISGYDLAKVFEIGYNAGKEEKEISIEFVDIEENA